LKKTSFLRFAVRRSKECRKNKLLADTQQERFDDWLAKAKQEIYIEVLK